MTDPTTGPASPQAPDPMTGGADANSRTALVAVLIAFGIAPLAAIPRVAAAQQTPAANPPAPPVNVVVTATPIPGTGIDRDKIAANPQMLNTSDIRRDGRASVLDALQRSVAGLALNQAQNNPFQPNLVFRGFEASPLAGDAQGLAVYMNGVRFNQSFGDTVDWDLIPDSAVENITIEGTNPVFGLNALGGSLAIEMKNGFTYQGVTGEVSGGSFGRISGGAEIGLSDDHRAIYLAANRTHESGWRPHSPSDLRQIYGDIGWRDNGNEVHLNITGADNDLTGNGTAPVDLIAVNRKGVFTYPDATRNRYIRISPTANIGLGGMTALQATAYYGHLRQHTLNGDAADAGVCASDNTVLCTEDGDTLTDATGAPIANFVTNSPYLAYAGLFTAPDWINGGPYAFLNRTSTSTDTYGGSVQVTYGGGLFGHENQLIVGASYDHGRARFGATTEIGALTLDRGFAGPGIQIDSPAGDITPVSVVARNAYTGIYISDVFDLTPELTATLSGRYNRARVKLIDRLGTALNGLHHYDRFNPSAGLAYTLMSGTTLYARYSESNRIPTPAELSCADPASPCSLTNFFVGDPSLDQVVAKTIEAGLRGHVTPGDGVKLEWSAAAFTTRSQNDIQYVASGTTGRAYFRNIGETRRRGVEAGLTLSARRFSGYLNYAYTDATYRTALLLNSPNNPMAAANGTITVRPGDQLPGIPHHSIKFGAKVQATRRLALSFSGRAASGQYLFGDESNLMPKVPGYVTVNAHASYQLLDHVEVYGTINNLFDRHYATYGTFSATGGVPMIEAPNARNTRALSVAPPIAFFGGTRVHF